MKTEAADNFGGAGDNTRRGGPVCSPETLAQIADLELVARIIVEGLVSGLHRSPFHGYSAEFSQYRHYRPGDDLKYVDWKLVARTDRVYTKQFRETTNMAAALVLDTSASMAFPLARRSVAEPDRESRSAGLKKGDPERVALRWTADRTPSGPKTADRTLSKFRYAVIAAAALAHLISGQGDAIGLFAGERFLPPRAGRQHLRRLLASLGALEPQDAWQGGETVRRAAERLSRRGLLLVLSDFYDDEDRTLAELRRAARMGHEVVLFQILSHDEFELPYRRDLEFTDLETGRRLAINAGLARREYKDAIAAFLERWRSRAVAEGFQYSLIVTDTPPDRALRNFLLSRPR
jgi:uncharacterized protein (DUF58 family)